MLLKTLVYKFWLEYLLSILWGLYIKEWNYGIDRRRPLPPQMCSGGQPFRQWVRAPWRKADVGGGFQTGRAREGDFTGRAREKQRG